MKSRAAGFYELMRRRRTVRDFSDREIPVDVIEHALLTAGSAPSGAHRQPWHFVVVTDAEKKAAIREAAEHEERQFYGRRAPKEWLEALAPLGTDANKPFLTTAPVLIAVFLRRFSFVQGGGGRKRVKNYYTSESVGIATGLLISALHNAGVATLTHTPSPMRFLNRLLDRPRDERPYVLVVAGYPAPQAQVPVLQRYGLEELATFV
ncbi:MAG: nitroreductase family protein [Gammaproteobacteria bacterium]|nr:nitroreductase family protein [Gammaproteobacteria bacterium]